MNTKILQGIIDKACETNLTIEEIMEIQNAIDYILDKEYVEKVYVGMFNETPKETTLTESYLRMMGIV